MKFCEIFEKILNQAERAKNFEIYFVWTYNNFSRAPSIARWTEILLRRLSSSIFNPRFFDVSTYASSQKITTHVTPIIL